MPHHLRIPCPECQRVLRIRPDHVGQLVLCKLCRHKFTVPQFLIVACPSCHKEGKVRTRYVDRHLRCKHCRASLRTEARGSDASSVIASFMPLHGILDDLDDESGRLPVPPAAYSPSTPEAKGDPVGSPVSSDLVILQSEVRALRAEVEARGAERAAAQHQLNEAHGQIARLHRDIGSLQDQVADSETHSKRASALSLALAETQRELDRLREIAPREALAAAFDADGDPILRPENGEPGFDSLPAGLINTQAARLQVERDEAREEREQLRAQVGSYQAQVASLQAQVALVEGLNAEICALREEAERLLATASEVEPLRLQLQDAQSAALLSNSDREAIRAELDQLLSEIAGQVAAVAAERDQARLERDANRAELQRLETERQQALAEQATRHDALGDEVEHMADDLRAARAEADRLRADLREADRLRARLDETLASAEALRRERDDLRAERDNLAPRAELAEALAAERDAARAERDLHASARERDQAAAADTRAALARAQAERDAIQAALDAATRDAEPLRARLAELEQALDRSASTRDADLAEALRDAHQGWEAERLAWQARLQHEAEERLGEAGTRLRQIEQRTEAERFAWQARLEADRRQFEHDFHELEEEIEEYCREADTMRRDRDAARQQVELLNAERDALEAARQDANRRHNAEVAEMALALERLTQREAAASQLGQSASADLARVQAELDTLRTDVAAERQAHEQALNTLQHNLADAHARLDALPPAASEAEPDTEHDARLADALDQLQATSLRASRLETELDAARKQIDILCRDLALLQFGGGLDDDEDSPDTRATSSTGPARRTDDAEQQVQDLTDQLSHARVEIAQLRAVLDYLGVHDSAQRGA